MHSEFYVIDEKAAETINETKKNGGRIIAVGTTSTRTLETVADENGMLRACSGCKGLIPTSATWIPADESS